MANSRLPEQQHRPRRDLQNAVNTPAPEISVVVPTLDEEENVVEMAKAIDAAMAEAKVASYEIIFIDNGSSDRTIELVKALCSTDKRVKLIVNSRDFGQLRSSTH